MHFEPYIIDGNTFIKLNIDDLEFKNKSKSEDMLLFTAKAYNKLNAIKNNKDMNSKEWSFVFLYVNAFLATLSNEDKVQIAETFVLIRHEIDEYQAAKDILLTNTMIKKISSWIYHLDQSINLCEKMRVFVETQIPIGIMENAGTRPQDRPETTFVKSEVYQVGTITLLCKMLCPVFSAIMTVTDKFMGVGKESSSKTLSGVKESLCSCTLTGVINAHDDSMHNPDLNLKAVTEKLKNYLEHTTRQSHREDKDSNLVYGYDIHTLAYNLYCTLLVRRLVTVNLARSESNLMSYIVVCARRSVIGVMGQVAANAPTMSRTPIAAESDDEGNIARLETDSMTSRKTADIEALIAVAVQPTINKVMYLNDIGEEEFNACVEYYNGHPLSPNMINKQLNSLLYGRDFDGSQGIQMLKFPEFSKISILTQMILLQRAQDPAYRTLAHLVTARPRVGALSAASELNGNNLWFQVSSSQDFRACLLKFQNSTVTSRNKVWENHIRTIITDLTEGHYEYNTAPYLWDWLEEENMNGKIIPLNPNVLIAYCNFYNWELDSREMQRSVVS